jgi:hypothetical protein
MAAAAARNQTASEAGTGTCLGHLVRHAAEVVLVLSEAVDELAEEEEEDGHGGAVHHGAGAPGRHEQPVQRVREAEQLVERHALLRPLLHRLAPTAAAAPRLRLPRVLRHCRDALFSAGRLFPHDTRGGALTLTALASDLNTRGGRRGRLEAQKPVLFFLLEQHPAARL